jgi:hypothetical protein
VNSHSVGHVEIHALKGVAGHLGPDTVFLHRHFVDLNVVDLELARLLAHPEIDVVILILAPRLAEVGTHERQSLIELLHAQSTAPTTRGCKSDKEDLLTLKVKARLQRVGREMRMLVENADDQRLADPGLLRIIARAHDIQARLMQSTDLTLHANASQERVTPGYISRLLRLPLLAPDILTAIVSGKNPPQLTAKKLMRLALELPVDWTEQAAFGGQHSVPR